MLATLLGILFTIFLLVLFFKVLVLVVGFLISAGGLALAIFPLVLVVIGVIALVKMFLNLLK